MRRLAIVTLILLATLACDARADRTITVAADGSGDCTTIQAAIDAADGDSKTQQIIHILPGRYREKPTVYREKPKLYLLGDAAGKTILTWDWNAKSVNDGKPVGTSGSASMTIKAADFTAENITFENTAGDVGQAVALAVNADRAVFRHCRMIGWQDTLYANAGRQLYQDCYIEGHTDFIFGSATAVFDHCEIHSKNGGYITAASTPKSSPFGYVFLDCKLTGDGAKAFLGRPWRPDAAVLFARCELGPHIQPAGWDNWRNPANEATARYFEFNCTGPGADRSARVNWAKELPAGDAMHLTIDELLAGDDHWNPLSGFPAKREDH